MPGGGDCVRGAGVGSGELGVIGLGSWPVGVSFPTALDFGSVFGSGSRTSSVIWAAMCLSQGGSWLRLLPGFPGSSGEWGDEGSGLTAPDLCRRWLWEEMHSRFLPDCKKIVKAWVVSRTASLARAARSVTVCTWRFVGKPGLGPGDLAAAIRFIAPPVNGARSASKPLPDRLHPLSGGTEF